MKVSSQRGAACSRGYPCCPLMRPTVPRRVACCSRTQQGGEADGRREMLALIGAALFSTSGPAWAIADRQGGMQTSPSKVLCEESCMAELEKKGRLQGDKGLEYIDIKEGTGASPPVGYQVVVNYVAMTDKGRVFESSLDRGAPYDIRVGTGQVIPGLDEGLKTMKTGGIRRLFIPGPLAFPNGVKAAVGRPSVPAGSPVIFDVQLLYVPGLDDE